jgi:hypothetical protein
MRSTPSLIAELEEESRQNFDAQMVVAFENSTIFIDPKDEKRLQLLNESITHGGVPMGLFIAKRSGGELTIGWRVYPEHAGETEQCEAFMDQLVGQLRLRLA